MDLERIKQNLRLRSGRSKKTRKPAAPASPAVRSVPFDQKNIPNGTVKLPSRPQTADTYGLPHEELSHRNREANAAVPQLSPIDVANLPQHRPGLPHASTGSDLKSSGPDRPLRFGRSGIERPEKQQPREPASKPTPLQRTMSETDTGVALSSDTSDALDFDLRPPPPRPKHTSVESLSESLFSSGHLNFLLRHPQYLTRLTSFIAKYRPQYHHVLLRYLETQKAIKAVEYANAVAEGIPPLSADSDDSFDTSTSTAAILDEAFEESSIAAFRLMADSALPMYITYNLVKLVTEYLINEITGRQTPLMQALVGGLSEVYCLSDPNQEDNPIIYASEEFYRFTGYGPDDVIGRNCRFLQGSKTKRECVARLKDSIGRGEDICETLLNYRRDGRPFINLLMIAPLHDDKGNVKYHIGAQIDVTKLVERGNGLDGFDRYLASCEIEKRERQLQGNKEETQNLQRPKALARLRDLSEMFDLEEAAVVRSHSRSTSASREDDEHSAGSSRKAARRVFGNSDPSSDNDDQDVGDNEDGAWKLGRSGRSGLSGRLPGVYDSYLLIRAAPSLRIVFVSPKLRQRLGNITQHPFLSHIAAPANTLAGLKESFGSGVPVSAKVNFMITAGDRRDGTRIGAGAKLEEAQPGRVCWISATPLLGSDDKIGVWMVVVVEKTKLPTTSRSAGDGEASANQALMSAQSSRPRKIDIPARRSSQKQILSGSGIPSQQSVPAEDMPIKPRRLEEVTATNNHTTFPSRQAKNNNMNQKFDSRVDDEGQQRISAEHKTLIEEERREALDPARNNSDPDHPRSPSVPDSSDEFVRPRLRAQESERSQRVHIRPDSEGEPDAPSILEANTAIEHSSSENSRSKTGDVREVPTDLEFQEESTVFHSFSDGEDTPIRPRHPEFADDTPSPSRPGTSGQDSSTGKSNGKHYMDYLLHPGSRPSSEYNRALSGSGFLSSKYYPEDWDQKLDQAEEEDFSDVQCARSPYSVD